MDGGLGQCKNDVCRQNDLLLEDGYCSDDCREAATGCTVPGCGCRGADAGLSQCTSCGLYARLEGGRCQECGP
jgi:hypothetical protein